MKSAILYEGTAGETQYIEVLNEARCVWANGLAGAESVAITYLATADDDTTVVGALDWLAPSLGGTSADLVVTNNMQYIQLPGKYKLVISSSAGAIRVGVSS